MLGPVAVRVQSWGWAVAPVVPLSTVLTRVRVAGWAVLVMVQIALSPGSRVTVASVLPVAPVQTQTLGSYPSGPSR